MPPAVTDVELARSAAQGDSLALERLLVRHQPALMRLIQAEMGEVVRARTTAEDLFMDSCVEAMRLIGRFEPRSEASVYAWLATIARNRVRDAARAAAVRAGTVGGRSSPTGSFELMGDLFAQLSAGMSTASHKMRRDELEGAVQEAVDALEHPQQRQAVMLRYFEGLALDDIARAMGVSVDAVRGHLHRAREPLARKLAALAEILSDH